MRACGHANNEDENCEIVLRRKSMEAEPGLQSFVAEDKIGKEMISDKKNSIAGRVNPA